ncbi:hypothetical protein [Streptomyces sp. NPDC021012]|uniref:hypothetical protein n=1 Tax=unclassified Streptomyces TaxID=2593676 RepID=UPI0037B445C1
MIGTQDLNLSACGADSVRAFHDTARTALTSDGRPLAGLASATKVIRPAPGLDLPGPRSLVDRGTADSRRTRALVCVPGQWGLIATARPGPARVAEEILRLEHRLRSTGRSGLAAL